MALDTYTKEIPAPGRSGAPRLQVLYHHPDKEKLRNYTQYALRVKHEKEVKTFEIIALGIEKRVEVVCALYGQSPNRAEGGEK